jgi:DNA polymerase-3 subunit delta'
MTLPWHAKAWGALDREALPQSLLLTAMAGTGEEAFARRLVQGQLCSAPKEDGAPCGACAECHLFEAATHPDVRLIGPGGGDTSASPTPEVTDGEPGAKESPKRGRQQITVDAIREIRDFLRLSAHRAGRRVVLILEAHTMNGAAANALLKLLEEPPPGAMFVLLSTQPARLPATVLSRCFRFHLPAPTRQEAIAWLSTSGSTSAELAVAQVGGAPCAAQALDDRYWELRRAVLGMLEDGGPHWLAVADSVSDVDLPVLVRLVQTCCWDLMAARFAGEIRYHLDQRERLSRAAARLETGQLLRMERSLLRMRALAEHPLNARLFAEDLLRAYSSLTTPQ